MSSSRFSRRDLLFGGGAATAGAVAAVAAERLLHGAEARITEQARQAALADAEHLRGAERIPFYGVHQAGIEMVPQTHQALVSLTLRDTATSPDQLRRMLRRITEVSARLTQGEGAEIDSEPELALLPARLTITIGFGRRLVQLIDPRQLPSWLDDLPAFTRDALHERWTGGDVLLQIAADDPVTVAHAQRLMLKTVREFATLRWVQQGFRRAYGSEPAGRTQRNLMGQLDGTGNAAAGSAEFERVVWSGEGSNPSWLSGGTGFVVRRIAMLLDRWDRIDRSGREQAIGRTIGNGAPLTGTTEQDEPDFEARNKLGFPVIGEFAHIRRARSRNSREQIYRRGYNYDLGPTPSTAVDQISDSGLIFTSFQYDVTTQFTPIQRRLDELDLLNEWISHIGSAVFAIPPGCRESEFIGQTLFE